MVENPLVTVAIPTFNRARLLQRALASALEQRIEGLEIIVADNASSDETGQVLRGVNDPRVRVIRSPVNVGMVGNWQLCLNAAKGRYFLLLSDDDAFYSSRSLRRLVSAFDESQHDEIGVVFGSVLLERSASGSTSRTFWRPGCTPTAVAIIDFLRNKVSVFPCATLLRTSDLRSVGAYSAFNAQYAVDACAWISIATRYTRVRWVEDVVARYRIHDSLSSSSVEIALADNTALADLIIAKKNSFSPAVFSEILDSLKESRNRAALGYILKRLKNDKKYNYCSAIFDLAKYAHLNFTVSNLVFIFEHLEKKISGAVKKCKRSGE